jgi:hypothetical protein
MEYQTNLKLTQANGDKVLLVIDFAKMDESWIKRCMEYGARRLVNDTYSGEKGDEKVALCKAMLDEMHNGKPLMVRERKAPTGSKADPVQRLARDKATTFLTAQLSAKLGKDMAIWAKNEKLAKLFAFTEKGNAKFDLGAVDQWIVEYKEKRDFVQEAKDELAMATNGVDLDDLGL